MEIEAGVKSVSNANLWDTHKHTHTKRRVGWVCVCVGWERETDRVRQ